MRTGSELIASSRLDEARAEVRSHEDIEAIILKRIARLPVDDFGHLAREYFQYGVGFAYLCVDGISGPDAIVVDESETVRIQQDVIDEFFHTRPRNKYLGFDDLRKYRETLEGLAIRVCLGEPVQCPDSIDHFEFAAFLSFIDGYQLVTNSITHNQH